MHCADFQRPPCFWNHALSLRMSKTAIFCLWELQMEKKKGFSTVCHLQHIKYTSLSCSSVCHKTMGFGKFWNYKAVLFKDAYNVTSLCHFCRVALSLSQNKPLFPCSTFSVVTLLLCSCSLNSLRKSFLIDSADESERLRIAGLSAWACVGGPPLLSYRPTCCAGATMSSRVHTHTQGLKVRMKV